MEVPVRPPVHMIMLYLLFLLFSETAGCRKEVPPAAKSGSTSLVALVSGPLGPVSPGTCRAALPCLARCPKGDSACTEACFGPNVEWFAGATKAAVVLHCYRDAGCKDDSQDEQKSAQCLEACQPEVTACLRDKGDTPTAGDETICSVILNCMTRCGGEASCETSCASGRDDESVDEAASYLRCLRRHGCLSVRGQSMADCAKRECKLEESSCFFLGWD